MVASVDLEADGDVTMLGGEAGQALPFDPRGPLPLARQETTALPVVSALPFMVGGVAPVPAQLPVEPRRVIESPAWVGMHPDPTRRDERPPVSMIPARPAVELERAARDGAAAASTAALAPVPSLVEPPRIKLLEEDTSPPPLELIDVIYAPKTIAGELRRVSSCCGGLHAPGATAAAQDPRRALHHAMSHARARSADDLAGELMSVLRRGGPPPVVVIAGVLSVAFDELASFKATLALATAFLRSEPQHAELLAHAGRLAEVAVELPDETLAFMRARLEEALRRTSKSAQLELARDKSLLERRRLASCEVLGGKRLRAALRSAPGRDIPCFLPVDAAAALPLSRTFPSIAVATVQSSPEAAGAVCLDVHSLGRPLGEGSAADMTAPREPEKHALAGRR
ncbi:MAG: hypothetical protein JNK04_13030 [Myxococcales bacterium]|nr:hypothetical protein [Myxococcales bacterium]